jgi:hypothetical protein
MRALEILQKIGRGTVRVGELVAAKDFSRGRADVPMRFEIEVQLGTDLYSYAVAFELPKVSSEIRVLEEWLTANSKPVILRGAKFLDLARTEKDNDLNFNFDPQSVVLPVLQGEPVLIFRKWLARLLILRPIPTLISGDAEQKTLEPRAQLDDLGAWFSGLIDDAPSAYKAIDSYLKGVMPDFKLLRRRDRNLVVQFSNEHGEAELPFRDLSDGEKCFVIGSLVLAANETSDDPVYCFWDEPDNYLALSEVQHFVMALRRSVSPRGQFIATSHNPEAIRSFSDENTLYLYRNNHLEPTIVRRLDELDIKGDLVGALTRGDLEP